MNWVEHVYPDDPVGEATCTECDTRTTVYALPVGLICDDCRSSLNAYIQPSQSYEPSLRSPDMSRDEELAGNVEAFTNELPDIGFDVEMQDGSTWEMDKFDSHAVLMKYGEHWQQYLPALATEVADHYENETEPSKFGGSMPWGATDHDDSQDNYDTHAALAPVVAYADLRAAKMQLGLMALNGPDGDDEDLVNVIGLGSDGELHQYTPDGRVTIEYDPDADRDFDLDTDGDQQ